MAAGPHLVEERSVRRSPLPRAARPPRPRSCSPFPYTCPRPLRRRHEPVQPGWPVSRGRARRAIPRSRRAPARARARSSNSWYETLLAAKVLSSASRPLHRPSRSPAIGTSRSRVPCITSIGSREARHRARESAHRGSTALRPCAPGSLPWWFSGSRIVVAQPPRGRDSPRSGRCRTRRAAAPPPRARDRRCAWPGRPPRAQRPGPTARARRAVLLLARRMASATAPPMLWPSRNGRPPRGSPPRRGTTRWSRSATALSMRSM